MSPRLERLERWQSIGIPKGASIWDVICGARDVADLDDNGKAMLQEMLHDDLPVRDTIEERMTAALADSANPRPGGPACSGHE